MNTDNLSLKQLGDKIAAADNESIAAAVREAGRLIGADTVQTERAVKNISAYKRKINRMSEQDLERALKKSRDKIGSDKVDEIIRSLNL